MKRPQYEDAGYIFCYSTKSSLIGETTASKKRNKTFRTKKRRKYAK